MVDLNKLNPKLKKLAIEFILECQKAKIPIRITQGFRSIEEQNELYAQGRTKPGKIVTNAKGGQSNHNKGEAIDICINIPGKTYDMDLIKKVAIIGKKLGLKWGGDFKTFKDYPHFEI